MNFRLKTFSIPARVMRGDTIAYKFNEVLYTPMFFINNIQAKLVEKENQQKSSPAEPIQIDLG